MRNKLLLMLLVALGLVAGTAQANMLVNPSFENGTFEANTPPEGWTDSWASYYSNMTWFDDAAGAHWGSKYIKMNPWATNFSSAWFWQTVDVTEGEEYAFSVWAKCPVLGETSEAWAYYEYLDSEDAIISEGWLPWGWDVGSNWTYVEFGTETAPESATQAVYYLAGVPENRLMGVLFDDAGMNTSLPSLPSPPWEALVAIGDVDLSWTNLDPKAPATSVYVDVLWGTEPNETDPAYDMEPLTLDPVSGQDVTSATIEGLALGTYYWQVDSYIYGDPAEVGYDINGTDPNLYPIIKGLAWSFDVVSDAPPSSVDAGVDMITWSGEPVNLDATIVDDDQSALTIAWSSDAPTGTEVLFPVTNIEEPTITINLVPNPYAAIVNPSFEDHLTGWDSMGGGHGTWAGTWNKIYIVASDGIMLAYTDSFNNDSDDAGLSQTLTETLTVDTNYTLTVDVANDGYYNEEVDYRVQLLAGGSVLAEDNNEQYILPIPKGNELGVWETSIVEYEYDEVADANKLGQPLEIRLLAINGCIEMSFDNVHLAADPPFPAPEFSSVELTVRAGDAANPTYLLKDTMTVDVYDTACAAAKAAGLSAENPGDFDGDCDTDLADIALLAEKWLNDTSLTEPVAKQTNQTLPSVSLIDNSGFEVPDQGDSGYTNPYPPTGVDGWTFTGGSGLSGPNGPWKCNSVSPDPLGDQFAYLQGAAAISQDLTGLVIGATYELNFFESYRTGMSSSNDLSVILDEGLGTEVTIYNNPDVTNTTWEARTTDIFYASKTSYTLTFRTTNPLGGDRSTIIDGVLITHPVDAGDDMITASGLAVPLAPSFSDGYIPTSYFWTTDAPAGYTVVFDPSATVETPTVAITPDVPGNPNTVTVTLLVNGFDEDSMEIDVYDDACLAAKAGMVEFDATDFDENCITDLADFAGLAATWFDDYTLTEPAEKP